MNPIKIIIILTLLYATAYAQPNRWQQQVQYTMDVNFDVATNQYTGTQKLVYTNHSPDTIKKLYYHLYYNAFAPNSMMDTRSRRQGNITVGRNQDWDARVKDRIYNLQPNEVGYQKIKSIQINNIDQPYTVDETILIVNLKRPILPNSSTTIVLQFEAQVPLQVRRSGRDNPTTGIRYSMSQWYPKLCEYDQAGWHPTPYIAREFYGVWGSYNVNITISNKFTLAGTGYLTNANSIGKGYQAKGVKVPPYKGDKLTWQFTAPNVHDFVWAADDAYVHDKVTTPSGVELHVFYKNDAAHNAKVYSRMTDKNKALYSNSPSTYSKVNQENWAKVLPAALKVLPYIEKNFGAYPYKQYSFIQGGDGGMEYPMATLLATSSLGTVFHEWMHTWYQMLLGSNESLYGYLDEGFTEWSSNLVSAYYANGAVEHSILGTPYNNHTDNYESYLKLVRSGLEEPLTTHADHFNTNYAYSNAAYNKGCVLLEQLGYIMGWQQRNELMLQYYNQWRYKHPNIDDFIKLAEQHSSLKLDWYKEYFVNGTKTIDYKIDSLWQDGSVTKIRLQNVGLMPMPIDVLITTKQDNQELHTIPLNLMYGSKPTEYQAPITTKVYTAWKWTHPTYIIETTTPLTSITQVEIDPTQRLADVDRTNNKLTLKW